MSDNVLHILKLLISVRAGQGQLFAIDFAGIIPQIQQPADRRRAG